MKHNGSDLKILLRKIRLQLPDFNDVLASCDKHGNEIIVATDSEFRQLILLRKRHLKMYTVRRCLYTYPFQQHPIPPDISPIKQLSLRSTNCLQGPPPSYRESQNDTVLQIHNPYHIFPHWGITLPSHVSLSSSFGYTCAHYNTAISTGVSSGRYGQSLIYGLPPQSSMMHSFLCSSFPFDGHHRSWICGSKCFSLSLGGKNNRYQTGSWWNTIL